ncbi:MAG: DUF177 domain-containing protein [Nitrospirae bacterium]|nr:DUF177 domain-containing protein [Nitrospirota bacterium]
MKILISEIPDEGIELKIDEPLEIDAVKLISLVRGELGIKKVGPEVVIEGEITAEAELECGRCLKNFTAGVNVPVNVMYHPVEELNTENKHEIREDALDLGFYFGDEFDVPELLKEQIILNIPMKPLCSETCKGICPKCGIDLNVANCSCKEKDVDPRFNALKKLLAKGA